MKKRILVTGAAGFTGSLLVKRLLKMKYEVVGLDNQIGYKKELEKKGAKIVIGSITDKKLVNELTKGCDIVFHLAAAFRKVNLPKKTYWDVNVNGTRYLCEASLRNKVKRFIYCSTSGVHGLVRKKPATEESPITPADYYQYTKHEGEIVTNEFYKKGLKTVIIRPGAIYGPGDSGRFIMIFKMVKKGAFFMLGKGKITYHPVYIDNLTDSFILAMNSNKAIGQTYLIADKDCRSIEDIVRTVAKVMKKKLNIIHIPIWPVWFAGLICEGLFKLTPWDPPIFRRRVDWFRQDREYSSKKAMHEINYKPKIALEEGLKRTYTWYKKNNLI
ncbi:MAG: NAD(P)-dependent oxidoreductase [Nanoarchaeota archaeon]|nr:NAD(P)-dependent oxidoreductase [Nanoarchaeota archaeon]